MKKINFLLLLCFGISCISYAQIASLSGNSEVEVGIANTYTVTLDSIPAGYSVVSYIWAVDYEGPMGGINGQPSSMPSVTTTTNQVSIIWDSFYAPIGDNVTITVKLKNSSNAEKTASATKTVHLNGICEFNVSGPSVLQKCCTNAVTYCASGYKSCSQASTSGFTFQWTYPSGWTVQGATTNNCITLLPNSSGGGVVNCVIKRPAAVATYSKSANTTVTRSNPSINVSGANTQNLCKGQAYSFGASGGTCGATITWTAPTGWTLQSQSGTNATFFASTTAISGAITATATYTGGCAASTSSLNIAVLSTPPANPIFMRDPQDGYLFYHCSAWRLCPGGRINAKIFAGTQSIKFELVGTNWKFGNGSQISQGPIGGLVGSYFEGVTQDELIDAVIFPTTGSNATSGTLKITAYNCVGASQTISVNFIREMNYFCNSNLSEGTCYPRTCSCCLPTDVPNCIGGPQRQIAPQQDEYLTSNLEEEADILQLYPNPTSGQCTARFSRPFTGAINVHDLQGCIIWSQNFENIMQTDLGRQAEMLPNGLYVITSIAADGVQHHEKFIISK